MPKPPDRAILPRLVDAYDRILEESLGLGDPEFHEIEDQLVDAIIDTPYHAVIKNGNIILAGPEWLPGEIILVNPAEPEDVVRAIAIIDVPSIEIIDGMFAIGQVPQVPVASSLLRFVR